MQRKLVVGNWKMYGSRPANAELLAALLGARPFGADVAVCVPYIYLNETAATLAGSDIRWGAQDVSAHEQGAYTGEVSAAMLAECGCRYVIVGHSERRAYHAEGDALVAQKAQAALARGVTPVVCVGETLEQREAGDTERVVGTQLDAVLAELSAEEAARIVVAYEPVWAIGTGKSAAASDAQSVHAFLRARLAAKGVPQVALLYGGSVKPENAAELFAQADIDGGLIGGAALKSEDFLAICRAAQ